MKKKGKIVLFIISFGFVQNNILYGQKKLLDHSTASIWPRIMNTGISNDGRFVKYSIAIPKKETNLFVEATDLSWKKELPKGREGVFTTDSRRFIFRYSGDSLGILDLKSGNLEYIRQVANYIVPTEGEGSYIAYQRKDSLKALIVSDLKTGEERIASDVRTYLFSKNGEKLLITASAGRDSGPMVDVILLDLANNRRQTICHYCCPSQLTIYENGTVIAFLTKEQAAGHTVIYLRYFKDGMDSAEVVAGPSGFGLKDMEVADYSLFFRQGRKLFFHIEKKADDVEKIRLDSTGAQVTISGVHDLELPKELSRASFMAVANLNESPVRVIRLQHEEDKEWSFALDDLGKWFITQSNMVGDPHDNKWNISSRPDVYLVSTEDGSRRLLLKRGQYVRMVFSPSGKYVIWFDEVQRNWFCYNTIRGSLKNITRRIDRPVYFENDLPDLPEVQAIAGWLEHDAAVLVYDRNDLWEVDPDGLKPPINITHGFGAANEIRFNYLSLGKDLSSTISAQDTLLLSAFDLKGKKDGFFRLDMNSGRLEKLTMSSNIYTYQTDDFCGARHPDPMRKAKNTSSYLLSRMSATEYPNLYVTTDFKDFKAVTDLAPQKEYNWYTTELVHWKLPDGKPGEGILFKPEDFDPKTKYPVIFYYYEKNAFNLNIFIHPELGRGTMNIPWFVSHGYLVFVPDIYYRTGHPGQSALSSVESAALFLSKEPWVDPKRMGLQGHSYGGFETEYIMTHSTLFKAAAPASAVSNMVSCYVETGIPWYYESRQGRIGASLWQRPDLYIENSAIFSADKVTASVLIMQTKEDVVVPYSQGIQMYNALLRLGKKAWLLTYEGESHTLEDEKDQLDYSIRLSQFFDYYLKGLPAPKWMTRGVKKGTDDGLQLDMSGKEP